MSNATLIRSEIEQANPGLPPKDDHGYTCMFDLLWDLYIERKSKDERRPYHDPERLKRLESIAYREMVRANPRGVVTVAPEIVAMLLGGRVAFMPNTLAMNIPIRKPDDRTADLQAIDEEVS